MGEASPKGLYLIASIALALMVMSYGISNYNKTKPIQEKANNSLNVINQALASDSYGAYDGQMVSGAEVISAINTKASSQITIYVTTSTSSKNYNSPGYNATDVTDPNYIEENGQFEATLNKNENGSIVGITFTQKSSGNNDNSGDSGGTHDSKTITVNKESENIGDVNISSIEYSDEEGYTGTLTGQGVTSSTVQTGGSYTSASSKTVTDSRTSSSNNLPSSISYNSEGYTGTLTGQGVTSSTTQTGGSYTPADSKTATDSRASSSNNLPSSISYSSDGYTGTLTGQGVTSSSTQTGGSYTPADSKTVTVNGSVFNVYYNMKWNGTSWEFDSWTTSGNTSKTYNYNQDGYSGTLEISAPTVIPSTTNYPAPQNPYVGQTFVSDSYTAYYIFSGTVTRPASDTRTYSTTYTQNYTGTVTKPASDTRTYGTTYTQNYAGTVTRPASDTRTYKTIYSQNFTGTVTK